jgi:hypothetical protein
MTGIIVAVVITFVVTVAVFGMIGHAIDPEGQPERDYRRAQREIRRFRREARCQVRRSEAASDSEWPDSISSLF